MRVFCGFHNLWRLEEEDVKHFIVLRSKKGDNLAPPLTLPTPIGCLPKARGQK